VVTDQFYDKVVQRYLVKGKGAVGAVDVGTIGSEANRACTDEDKSYLHDTITARARLAADQLLRSKIQSKSPLNSSIHSPRTFPQFDRLLQENELLWLADHFPAKGRESALQVSVGEL